jgi:fumarate reductase flavoprotein subunit
MSGKNLDLTRRKFMAVSSVALAAPIIRNMADIVPEVSAAEKKVEKQYDFADRKECDLVVLGGGGSGLIAAVRAAQLTGKKVIVLEKAAFTGGGALGASTVRTFGSKWQKKNNLPDTTAEYARTMMDTLYWKLDPKLVSNCLLGTGQFFDWLCEQGDNIEDQFKPGKYVFASIPSEPIGPQMSRQIGSKQGFGLFVTSMMVQKAKTSGVEILTKHPVVDVEVQDGRIIAAIAKSDKGYVRVACKACVISTGSWINNEEILKKYAPEFAAVYKNMNQAGGAPGGQGAPGGGAPGGAPGGQGAPGGGAPGGAPGGQGAPDDHGAQAGAAPGGGGTGSQGGHTNSNYTGDGIALAEKVGAFVDYNSFCIRLMGPMSQPQSKVFSAMVQTPFVITVNLNGNRFVSEPLTHIGIFAGGHVQLDQPNARSYDIFDQNTIAAALEYQKCIATSKCIDERSSPLPESKTSLPATMEEITKDLDQYLATAGSSMFKADTLEELADKIGVNKKNFLETVKTYNEGCAKGADLECFKKKDYLAPINKAPYYASSSSLGTDGAFGGVRVNPEMQAYKADRKSLIKGLYVTGDFATGRHISLGGVKIQVLNDLSWAFSSGFLAGTNAANYLKSIA